MKDGNLNTEINVTPEDCKEILIQRHRMYLKICRMLVCTVLNFDTEGRMDIHGNCDCACNFFVFKFPIICFIGVRVKYQF